MSTPPSPFEKLQRIESFAASRSFLAPVILRLGLGAVFLAHSYAKVAIFTLPGTVAFFETHGLPGWTVYPVLAIEVVAGLCLVLGIRVRLAAAALLPVMLGALVPHASNGWMFTNSGGGREYVAFLLVALAAQVLLGRGTLLPPSQGERRQ
jgi:putative oxidoreductase